MLKTLTFQNTDGSKSLLELLAESDIYVFAPCGGNGTCKKCKVVMNGETVLACKTFPTGDVIVEAEDTSEQDSVVKISPAGLSRKESGNAISNACTVAVDLGTTSLAAVLIDETGCILGTALGINHQRSMGADVLSRITAQTNGKGEWLQKTIRKDIATLTEKLDSQQAPIVIAGNTTMQHLFMGYDCAGLGTAPYQPVDISLNHTSVPLTGTEETDVILLPGIGAYVGADIVSGICALDMDLSEHVNLMIDLGTNAEMVVGNKDRLLCTSAAAGPAFEGGNISCGMPATSGAISDLMIRPDSGAGKAELAAAINTGQMTGYSKQNGFLIAYKTVEDAPPRGICGSGIIAAVSELLTNELLDETGILDDEQFEDGVPLAEGADGPIVLTQGDIRGMQMAKANIRAGIDTLLDAYGVSCSDIAELYLAGSFGQNLNIQKAAVVGIIPPELEDKAQAVGNTSAMGAFMYATELAERRAGMPASENGIEERVQHVAEYAEVLDVAAQTSFSDFFMDGILFG